MARRHTEHYGLSQWEASDKVERTDFNADNAAVDGALHALAQSKAETADLSQLSGLVAQKADQTALEALEGRLDSKADQEGLSGVERPPVSRGGLHAPHRLRQLHRKRDQRPRVPCLPHLFLPAPAFGGCAAPAPPPTVPACSSSGASPREAAWGTSTSMSMSPGREIRSPGTPQRTTPPPR